jgi:hypothetical protein
MRKKFLWAALAVPLLVAGLLAGHTLTQRQDEKPGSVQAESYTCPLTGEELPCPLCCPLNGSK